MIYAIGIIALLVADIFIVFGYLAHWRSINKDILADDERKLREWAEQEAEIRAEERVREILSSIQYSKRVELVNESDINWGE